MPFKNSNTAAGLPSRAAFQVGVSDVDPGTLIERGKSIPYVAGPSGLYLYYECSIDSMLDSGIVVHNRLPQINNPADTLASITLDTPNLDTIVGPGVNLKCQDQYQDIIQRMGHARYWFRIWGRAIRIKQQVPIPGIKMIAGVPAIPDDRKPQWAYNRIAPGGNYGGVVVWMAAWSLWYTTAVPPISQTVPAADPYAHITGSTRPPASIQPPYTQKDDDAQSGGGGLNKLFGSGQGPAPPGLNLNRNQS